MFVLNNGMWIKVCGAHETAFCLDTPPHSFKGDVTYLAGPQQANSFKHVMFYETSVLWTHLDRRCV